MTFWLVFTWDRSVYSGNILLKSDRHIRRARLLNPKLQISSRIWIMKRQNPMKSPHAANGLRTPRWQLWMEQRIDAWGMPFHIRWTAKRKSATLRMMVFLFRFKPGLLLGQSKTSTASRRGRSLVFAVCVVVPSWMKIAGPAAGGCQGVVEPERWGPRQNSAKVSCCHGSRPVGVNS